MKVLVVSHNCFSTIQNMGKTLISLFSKFDKSELMQLYLYPSTPNVDLCERYFRITDKDVLKAIVKRKFCGGEIVAEDNSSTSIFESDEVKKQYNSINRNSSFSRRLRDFAWKLGKWKSKQLKEWLSNGKPDVVFYALGDATFSQNIAMWVAKYLNIPLVTYVCDEYYFSGKQAKLGERLINVRMLSNIKKTIKRSSLVVSICDELGKAYQSKFNTPYRTVMTGSSFKVGNLEKNQDTTNQISYIGNLSLNRYKSLLDIQHAINTFNQTSDKQYELIYYGRERPELMDKIKYGGFLNPDGVKSVMSKSTILVHIETFDKQFRARLKYSVSTKIADSLASGTCLLAYGPQELASISYLKANDCAFCVTDRQSLNEELSFLLANKDQISKYATKGIEQARQKHDAVKNSNYLHKVLREVVLKDKVKS